jgi:hypothetical protein
MPDIKSNCTGRKTKIKKRLHLMTNRQQPAAITADTGDTISHRENTQPVSFIQILFRNEAGGERKEDWWKRRRTRPPPGKRDKRYLRVGYNPINKIHC